MDKQRVKLTRAGDEAAAAHRVETWRQVVEVLRKNGLVVRPGQTPDFAALKAVIVCYGAATIKE